MTQLERAEFLAHATTRRFNERGRQTRETIARALSLSSRPYVAFSAGKDSSAMLWLVLEQRPDVQVRMAVCGETRILHPELDLLIAWWTTKFPALDFREVVYRMADDGRPLLPTEGPGGTMRKALIEHDSNHDAVFVGTRSAESRHRALSHAWCRDDARWPIYTYAEGSKAGVPGARRVCPMEKWTERDVWAQLVFHGIPVLAAYDHGDGTSERTTLRLTETDREGTLAKLRRRNPDAYYRLISLDPDLALPMLYPGDDQ